MIVYEATKEEFLKDVYNDQIDKKIGKKIITKTREPESWIDSANYMEKILRDRCFPNDISVAMEFKLYNSKMRVDFIITGLNAKRKNTMIIIEFKRWSKLEVVTDRDDMVEVEGLGIRQHPSYQALSYAKTIKNFYTAANDNQIMIKTCSCLHRYEKTDNDSVTNIQYKELLKESPIFLNGETN